MKCQICGLREADRKINGVPNCDVCFDMNNPPSLRDLEDDIPSLEAEEEKFNRFTHVMVNGCRMLRDGFTMKALERICEDEGHDVDEGEFIDSHGNDDALSFCRRCGEMDV